MRTTFFLVRHGVKEKRIGDVSITSEGAAQAKSTALHLANVPVTKIIASPLRRAIDTAAHISLQTNVTVMEDLRLRERANWGTCLNKPLKNSSRCGTDAQMIQTTSHL